MKVNSPKNKNRFLERALQKERDITFRRLIKLFCYVLNKRYGFGKKRCAYIIMDIADLVEQGLKYWEGDLGDFWYKIDKDLNFMRQDMEFFDTEDNLKKKGQ